jgi:hypothetical protein
MRAGQIVEHLALRDDLGLLRQAGSDRTLTQTVKIETTRHVTTGAGSGLFRFDPAAVP